MDAGLTEQQRKWFASLKANLERETGKSLEDWVAIARACPETGRRKQQAWLKARHGLGQNRAVYVLSEAFPSPTAWDQPDALRAALWSDPAAAAVLEAVEEAVSRLPDA